MPLHNTFCPVVPGEHFESHIERFTIGVILSAMAYGGVLSLTLSYVSLLLKTSYDIPRRMRIFLLVYVMFMLAISTVYIIIIIIILRIALSKFSSGSNNDCGKLLDLVNKMTYFQMAEASGACITLANWGADGFMLWRCVILYEGVSPPARIALNMILGFMALMSLGSGLVFIINRHGFLYFQTGLLLHGVLFFNVMTATTIIFNLVTATLITFRILYFDRHVRKTVGLERNNPYKTVIILCVESSSFSAPSISFWHFYTTVHLFQCNYWSTYMSYLHFLSSTESPRAELPPSAKDLRKIDSSYHHCTLHHRHHRTIYH